MLSVHFIPVGRAFKQRILGLGPRCKIMSIFLPLSEKATLKTVGKFGVVCERYSDIETKVEPVPSRTNHLKVEDSR
jgi:hypothetical protein